MGVAGIADDAEDGADAVLLGVESLDELRVLLHDLRPLEEAILTGIHIDCLPFRELMRRYDMSMGEVKAAECQAYRHLRLIASMKGKAK